VAAPEERKVTSKLRVRSGAEFDVSTVPGVLVGEKLMITRNPWRSDVAQVVSSMMKATRRSSWSRGQKERVLALPKARRYWRRIQSCRRPRRKRRSKGTAYLRHRQPEETEAAQQGEALPFGGRLDPYKHIDAPPGLYA
jgi:hypothetical protein